MPRDWLTQHIVNMQMGDHFIYYIIISYSFWNIYNKLTLSLNSCVNVQKTTFWVVTSNVRFNYYLRSFGIQIWCRTRNSYSIDTLLWPDMSNILSSNLSIELCCSVWDICQLLPFCWCWWNHSLESGEYFSHANATTFY